MRTALILLIFGLLYFFCCSPVNKFDVWRYKNKFARNKAEFEKLVTLLKTQPIRVGYSINQNELSAEVQELLRDLDIHDINANRTSCDGIVDYQFETGWSREHVFLSKDPCSITEDGPTGMIDFYNLGDDWCMWIDHDFI